MSCVQALASVDIGSLICNVGAGGAAPAPAAGGAAPAAGEAPGNTLTRTEPSEIRFNLVLKITTTPDFKSN